MPEGTMKVPIAGNVKKQWVYIGGAAVAGIVAIVWWRKRQAAKTAATTGDTSQSDQTGYADYYGDPAYSGGGFTYPVPGVDYNYPYPSSSISSSAGQYTTNQDWLAAAEGNVPGDQTAIALALTRILGGLQVNQAQADIFHEAVGILGQEPPQGYPPIRLVTSTGPGDGSGGSGSGGSVPGEVTGLKGVGGHTTVRLTWNKVNGATGYHIYSGTSTSGRSTTSTTYQWGSLKRGHEYKFSVAAYNSHGVGPRAFVTVKTG